MSNLPFVEEILADLRRFKECAEDDNDVYMERSRFDLLVQLGLLERVQRSPARWMMTQAGEDAIAQPAAGEPVATVMPHGDYPYPISAEIDRLLPVGTKLYSNSPPAAAHGDGFQARVQPWMLECFGEAIASDRGERNHRFLEEALELVQSTGCTASEANQLVDYVFGRPVGEPTQEVGGVMVTLAALCLANGLDMHDAAEVELARIWTKVEAIRAKQAAKPKHSPLPVAAHGDEAVRKDSTEAQMQRACAELPEDWYVEIHLENGSGYATLFNDGIVVDFGQDFGSIGAHVEAAIDAAMRAQAGEGGE